MHTAHRTLTHVFIITSFNIGHSYILESQQKQHKLKINMNWIWTGEENLANTSNNKHILFSFTSFFFYWVLFSWFWFRFCWIKRKKDQNTQMNVEYAKASSLVLLFWFHFDLNSSQYRPIDARCWKRHQILTSDAVRLIFVTLFEHADSVRFCVVREFLFFWMSESFLSIQLNFGTWRRSFERESHVIAWIELFWLV